jgi:serine/threonine protein kinase/Tfp pilus assembly protein PilF
VALGSGTRIGPYEILAQIGAGGMGEVYRAADTTLKRHVALKMLPSAVASDRGRIARLKREAEVLASLNHPNIAAIYGFEDSGGTSALVMELVEGPTLADRIASGPMPADEALSIAKQIADALDTAHRTMIFHRDLKPANIKVRLDGTVKVLDFGLAKTVEAAQTSDGSQLQTISPPVFTEAGLVLGTPAYMAPEQAAGGAIDARCDIFSFGCILYEMLSGRRAFNGDSSAATLAAVLRDDPPPLQGRHELGEIVTRCLCKSPTARFQNVAALRVALAAIGPVDPTPSIAVLPFANMSDDKSQEYFSDGLAEEITNALVEIPGLKVTARTSAFAFRGKQQDIRTIAHALNVNTILEGSVRKSGNRIRVTAQLINASDGYHLWSQRYDRQLADVFVMQDEIAAAIAAALRLTFGGPPSGRRPHQPDLRAYEAFLKGRHLVFVNTAESIARAKDAFEQAIAIDPEFPDAHAELATWHFVQVMAGLSSVQESLPTARIHALKAVELMPAEPRAQAVLGAMAALYEHDWDRARERFQLAMAAPQVPPEVRFRYAMFYLVPLARINEAIDQIGQAVAQDPMNVLFRAVLALVLISDSPDRGRQEARRTIAIDDRHWLPYYVLGLDHFRLGQLAEASKMAEQSAGAAPSIPMPRALLAGLRRQLKDDTSADALLSGLTSPSGRFIYHMICGDIDLGAQLCAQAIAAGEVQPLMWLGGSGFLMGRLRSSAHWPVLARALNLPDTTRHDMLARDQ